MFGLNEMAWYSLFLGVAVKSTAVLGVAWFAALLLKRRSAAARHLVWTAAAAAVLALPLLSVSLPALRFPAPAALIPADIAIRATAATGTSGDAAPARSLGHAGAIASLTSSYSRPDWRMWFMLLWVVGAVVALAQMLLACATMLRLRRRARPFCDRDLCGSLARGLGIRHPVDVLETKAGSMPMTFGVVRSAIFLPSDAAEWSEERRRVVLLHELAHVRRGDVATHLLARTAMTLYWWNPLAWIAWREFLKERERAADDLVLNAGARASEYASHLLDVARCMQSAPAIRCAAVAMARRSQLEGRLLAILDSGINRTTPARASIFVAALVALGMVAPLAAIRAQAPDNKAQALPDDVDATIRAATSQKKYEILENAATAAQHLHKYDTAQKLLLAAAEIRAEVSGRQSSEYGLGLLSLADLDLKRHLKKPAEELYTQAAQLLGERPEAARALMPLGIGAFSQKDFAQAVDFFEHALRVDPSHAGRALMWMAVVRQTEQKTDEAEALYQRALSAQAPESTAAMRLYAQFLSQQGRANQASELDARVRAMQIKSKAATTAGTYRMSTPGVTPPTLLNKIEPEYTEEARAAQLQGTEILSVEIGPDGFAHNTRVLQGVGLGLDENAIDAISQWTFKPGTKDGQPVTVVATIEVNWRLSER